VQPFANTDPGHRRCQIYDGGVEFVAHGDSVLLAERFDHDQIKRIRIRLNELFHVPV